MQCELDPSNYLVGERVLSLPERSGSDSVEVYFQHETVGLSG